MTRYRAVPGTVHSMTYAPPPQRVDGRACGPSHPDHDGVVAAHSRQGHRNAASRTSPNPGEPEDEGPIAAAAAFLVQFGHDRWPQLLDEHSDDGTGHCRGCRGLVWPCSLYVIAERAQRLIRADGSDQPPSARDSR